MGQRMEGKVALVTGAARGQGRAHAIRLAEEGADILAFDCPADGRVPYPVATSDELKITVKEVEALGRRIIAHEGDVREQAPLDNLVAEGVRVFGGVDVAVANAGIWTVHPFADIPEDEFADVLNVNIMGVWRTLKAVTPAMKARGGGSVIITSSGNGVEGSPHYVHYVASKHGVLGLAKGPRWSSASTVSGQLPSSRAYRYPALDWQGGYDLCAGKGPGQGTKEDLQERSTGRPSVTWACCRHAP